MRWLSFLIAAWEMLALPAATDLRFQPIIKDSTYCQEPKGALKLRLHLELRSQTSTGVPLLLPLFAQVTGYELYRDESAVRLHQVESTCRVHLNEILDATKLSSVAPDPSLFRKIPAGETALWHAFVQLPVMTRSQDVRSLLGKDRYLCIRINPWPAARKRGEQLRKAWMPHGALWTTEFVSLPLKIHIEQQPKVSACQVRVD